MKVTDQPGRIAAIFIVGPALILMGVRLTCDTKMNVVIGKTLVAFGLLFLVYETFWITKATKYACI